jgi:hypothetical protein
MKFEFISQAGNLQNSLPAKVRTYPPPSVISLVRNLDTRKDTFFYTFGINFSVFPSREARSCSQTQIQVTLPSM